MTLQPCRGLVTAALALAFVALTLTSGDAPAQRFGKGKGKNDPAFFADRDVFHYLLDNRKAIRRTVKKLADGVETVTESDRAEVAKKIQEHAEAMHKRVKTGNGIRLRDPLFAELFRHHDKIRMTVERTAKGVKVKETSADKRVVRLIQAHAEVVSRFIEKGYAEAHRDHPVPKDDAPKGDEARRP